MNIASVLRAQELNQLKQLGDQLNKSLRKKGLKTIKLKKETLNAKVKRSYPKP